MIEMVRKNIRLILRMERDIGNIFGLMEICLKEGNYVNYKKDGVWKKYTPKGNIDSIYEYKNEDSKTNSGIKQIKLLRYK